jgi:hypothetical protein
MNFSALRLLTLCHVSMRDWAASSCFFSTVPGAAYFISPFAAALLANEMTEFSTRRALLAEFFPVLCGGPKFSSGIMRHLL